MSDHSAVNLVKNFYDAFIVRDYRLMQNMYHKDAVFYDPVFRNLNVHQVGAMWEMFCVNSQDLNISYRILSGDRHNVHAEWVAVYRFGKKRHKVNNIIQAHLSFEDGKIIQHTDHFDLYRWTKQAFGLTGYLLGWSSWFQNKLRQKAMQTLSGYISKNASI
jgi:ketosteroid isomerase-like protein